MELKCLIPPVNSIVQLETVKAHLRLDHEEEDTYLEELVRAATNHVENYLGRALLKQTWQLEKEILSHSHPFSGKTVTVSLPYPPFLSIESLISFSKKEEETVIRRYMIHQKREFPEITFLLEDPFIRIIYQAGYGEEASSIPAAIRHAVLLLAADFYENRIPSSRLGKQPWCSLLEPFRIHERTP